MKPECSLNSHQVCLALGSTHASCFDASTRGRLLAARSGWHAQAKDVLRSRVPMHPDLLQRATRMDFANYLAEDILVKVDRASMLNSLELRAPLLDYRLIEFAFGKVPSHLKATAQDKKILLKRLRAHAAICFMALILYRVMRSRLRQSETQLSPERALAKLRRIQHQRITLNTQPIAGLSSITQEHTDILTALTIKKPTMNAQLTLL